MKKITFFLFVLVNILSVDVSYAQNFTLGLRGGISIPNLTAGGAEKNPLNTGYSSRLDRILPFLENIKFLPCSPYLP
jgi:hypothetical protein